MSWGAQTRDSKKKGGLRTDEESGQLLWGAQTKPAKKGRPDKRDIDEGEVWTGTKKVRWFD